MRFCFVGSNFSILNVFSMWIFSYHSRIFHRFAVLGIGYTSYKFGYHLTPHTQIWLSVVSQKLIEETSISTLNIRNNCNLTYRDLYFDKPGVKKSLFPQRHSRNFFATDKVHPSGGNMGFAWNNKNP